MCVGSKLSELSVAHIACNQRRGPIPINILQLQKYYYSVVSAGWFYWRMAVCCIAVWLYDYMTVNRL